MLKEHQGGASDQCKVSKRELSRIGCKSYGGDSISQDTHFTLKKTERSGTFQRVSRSVTFLLPCHRSYCCVKIGVGEREHNEGMKRETMLGSYCNDPGGL